MTPAAKDVLILYSRHELKRNQFFVKQLRGALRGSGVKTKVLSTETIKNYSNKGLASTCSDVALILMRSRDTSLATALSQLQIKVLNDPWLLKLATDKYSTYIFAKEMSIATPPTKVLTPEQLKDLPFDYPYVVKDRFGHGGDSVFLVSDPISAQRYIPCATSNNLVVQPFVHDVVAEWRAYVVGDEIFAWVKKVPRPGEFRANYACGSSISISAPPDEVHSVAKRIKSVLGSGLYGIDIIETRNSCILGEIEDPVGFRALYILGKDPTTAIANFVQRYAKS
ncbi:Glutathione synthase/RimK-type ligase, ATP-grasp superfamily [Ferrithrix thermotolerans DSM 19514]|uniref:Glutathione synthase/RimK-type ligase, ATP-grasp superfamily n=1 Tax=Ferrithrix thermotolerans DSM 19514 TaxID=1121881 RepID=A0A1M4V7V7_9ACTN|nr:ATP-grasp domain-containing protein [Ferrithrix thermotolerans]SHE65034.1 Glutathione synthase/RimK-type ligase, ATP-grasp superfamily [Ferrithrix thermotolerans DSM 19514]